MKICEHCNKTFTNYRQLNGHMRIHGKSGGGYSKPRNRKNPRTFICLACGIENNWSRSSYNKYCNNVCKGRWEYENIHIPLILEGKKTDYSGTLRRYIFERDNNECTKCGLGPEWNGQTLRLQVDHIDGNSDNNFPHNLRVLCPNCHTQTKTWGSKGKGSRNIKYTKRNTDTRRRRSCS